MRVGRDSLETARPTMSDGQNLVLGETPMRIVRLELHGVGRGVAARPGSAADRRCAPLVRGESPYALAVADGRRLVRGARADDDALPDPERQRAAIERVLGIALALGVEGE